MKAAIVIDSSEYCRRQVHTVSAHRRQEGSSSTCASILYVARSLPPLLHTNGRLAQSWRHGAIHRICHFGRTRQSCLSLHRLLRRFVDLSQAFIRILYTEFCCRRLVCWAVTATQHVHVDDVSYAGWRIARTCSRSWRVVPWMGQSLPDMHHRHSTCEPGALRMEAVASTCSAKPSVGSTFNCSSSARSSSKSRCGVWARRARGL